MRCARRPRGAASGGFAPSSYFGSLNPDDLGTADRRHCGRFLPRRDRVWVLSSLRKPKRSQLRRNAFVSSALNDLSQGVVMIDALRRIIFCNDRYLEIYGLVARGHLPAT